jgi:hypothetical protein
MLQLFSFGNLKQDGGTAIFNFCPSADCPSEKLGLCKLPGKCYAKKAERIFPVIQNLVVISHATLECPI